MEMTKKIYLETLKSALGRSIFCYYFSSCRDFSDIFCCAYTQKITNSVSKTIGLSQFFRYVVKFLNALFMTP